MIAEIDVCYLNVIDQHPVRILYADFQGQSGFS